MHQILDIISSGIHDAKNQLFLAESLITQAESEHGLKLDEARFAIEHAAARLSRLLTAYKLHREVGQLSIGMVSVGDLIEEAVMINAPHCRHLGLDLSSQDLDRKTWPLDRELTLDILSNAIQNASRHARSRIKISTTTGDSGLTLRIEDDGPGYPSTDIELMAGKGVGLYVANEIARQHNRGERHGSVALSNGGALGGAVFELRLP
jgi:signal transduction histidine kinase